MDRQFITKLLEIKQPMEENPNRVSTIALLLKGARKFSGRNLDTGIYEGSDLSEEYFQAFYSFQFSALINYLIFLEQVGSMFKPKNADGNGPLPPKNNETF